MTVAVFKKWVRVATACQLLRHELNTISETSLDLLQDDSTVG